MYQLLYKYYNKPEEMLVPAIRPGAGMPHEIINFHRKFTENVKKYAQLKHYFVSYQSTAAYKSLKIYFTLQKCRRRSRSTKSSKWENVTSCSKVRWYEYTFNKIEDKHLWSIANRFVKRSFIYTFLTGKPRKVQKEQHLNLQQQKKLCQENSELTQKLLQVVFYHVVNRNKIKYYLLLWNPSSASSTRIFLFASNLT